MKLNHEWIRTMYPADEDWETAEAVFMREDGVRNGGFCHEPDVEASIKQAFGGCRALSGTDLGTEWSQRTGENRPPFVDAFIPLSADLLYAGLVEVKYGVNPSGEDEKRQFSSLRRNALRDALKQVASSRENLSEGAEGFYPAYILLPRDYVSRVAEDYVIAQGLSGRYGRGQIWAASFASLAQAVEAGRALWPKKK